MEMHPKSKQVDDKLSPNWLELPHEVTVTILQKVGTVDILESVQRVCTQWESICKEPSLWRTVIFRNVDTPFLDLDSLFKEAVDRSCGGLLDLKLINCYDTELLKYATQRCTKIRRLRLVSSYVSDDGLCEAAKMFPLLEDLEISCCCMVTAKSLDKFGECCPLLKSLKMNRFHMWWNPSMDIDSEAMSIAENMVELRHLQLLENRLTNKGLKAILDNCIHLESLDLRQCPNLELEDDVCSLGKRCTESVRDFRHLSETFDYIDFDRIIYDKYEAACYISDFSYDYDDMIDMLQNIL